MYSLMKSEVIPFHPELSETVPSYRQVQLHLFVQLEAALTACEMFNDKSESHHYVVNGSGKKFYEGAWID